MSINGAKRAEICIGCNDLSIIISIIRIYFSKYSKNIIILNKHINCVWFKI